MSEERNEEAALLLASSEEESFKDFCNTKVPLLRGIVQTAKDDGPQSVIADRECNFLETSQVEQLASEIAAFLRKVSTSVDQHAPLLDQSLASLDMFVIYYIFKHLYNCAKKDRVGNAGGRFNLFCQTICLDPSTLEALLQICGSWHELEVSVSNKEVRCCAILILQHLCAELWMWEVKLGDGTLFCDKLIATMVNTLVDNANAKQARRNIHGVACQGKKGGAPCMDSSVFLLMDAVVCAKRPLEDIITFDWATIMDFQPAPPSFCIDMFTLLHDLASSVLVSDPSNDGAKTMIKKFGASKKLFQRLLEWVICGEADAWDSGMDKFIKFFGTFVSCLVPPPSDPKITKLVKRAGVISKQYLRRLDEVRHEAQTTVALMEDEEWKKLQRYSDEARWQLFKDRLEAENVSSVKQFRQNWLTNNKEGESRMCAKCFTLEKDLAPGQSLEYCSRCLGTCYCCRTCQFEHWDVHKTKCKKVAVAK